MLNRDYRVLCVAMISIATVISISTIFGYNHTLQTLGLVTIAGLAGLSIDIKNLALNDKKE